MRLSHLKGNIREMLKCQIGVKHNIEISIFTFALPMTWLSIDLTYPEPFTSGRFKSLDLCHQAQATYF